MDKTKPTEARPFAPVLVSVYDRRKHLEMCIESLKENPEAKDTPLYIVSDGWQHEGHRKAIEDVRAYINTITGFKEVNTRFRKENWGMKASAREAAEWVFSKYDRMIRMEDDIICSPHYLQYLNNGLDAYENDENMFCVCAHIHPKFKKPQNYPHDVFLWQSFSPWGYGIWKNRYQKAMAQDHVEFRQFENSHVWKRFKKIRPLGNTREEYTRGKIKNDARMNAFVYVNNLHALFPTKSLTINSGMDGSGTNCALGWTYPEQKLNDTSPRTEADLQPSEAINAELYQIYFSFVSHRVTPWLRKTGCFNPLYKAFQKLASTRHR